MMTALRAPAATPAGEALAEARQAPLPAFSAAYGAMAGACAYLIARAQAAEGAAGDLVAWRRAGNDLKELDRFLSVLLEECAALDVATGRQHQPSRRAVIRRAGLLAMMPRLRAIDRLRGAACTGPVAAGCHRLLRDQLIATAGAPGALLGHAALAELADFYWSIARRLRADRAA